MATQRERRCRWSLKNVEDQRTCVEDLAPFLSLLTATRGYNLRSSQSCSSCLSVCMIKRNLGSEYACIG